MRVSLKWLQEFVPVTVEAEELAERLTMAGLNVAAVTRPGRDIKGVVTGRIAELERHVGADRLLVCTVDTGTSRWQVVTGAPNVRQGATVALATEGATLPGGVVIKRARFRGVESRGMLCSAAELGLDPRMFPPEQAQGVLILDPEVPLGEDIRTVLGLDDAILDIEVTPNRGDCMSVLGIAREVAALLGLELRLPRPAFPEGPESIEGRVEVEIRDARLCRRYAARLFTDVSVGPSPLWMQLRLQFAGIRPIANIVDLTNYVMLELGQPLHAFDYDAIAQGKIIVRQAAPGEKIVSLDGVERELAPEMLVIADPRGPVAIAGVMGGEATEVKPYTRNILLESAYFQPLSIRRTSRRLGLISESSSRFEKGVDPEGCRLAADRVAELVHRLGIGKVAAGVVDNYPAPHVRRTVFVRPEWINEFLGTDISADEMRGRLASLGCEVRREGNGLLVTVPSHRGDLHQEADLAEEIARLYGFDRIVPTLPRGVTTQGRRDARQELVRTVRRTLVDCGLMEIVTFSFQGEADFDRLRLPPGDGLRRAVVLKNPLRADQGLLRTTLLPGLLQVLAHNHHRRVVDVAVFEVGRVFRPSEGEDLPHERLTLGMAATGVLRGSWNQAPLAMDFYFLKGALEALLEVLGISGVYFVPEAGHPTFHPGRTARMLREGRELGLVGELHPAVREEFALPARVVAAEVDLELLLDLASPQRTYRELPRYPAVERDLAVLVPEDVPAAEIEEAIRETGGDLLRGVRLFDVYRGSPVPEGQRSLAFHLVFQAPDRTLQDEEVARLVAGITAGLRDRFGAALRG